MSIIYSIIGFCWKFLLAIYNIAIKMGIVASAVGSITLLMIFLMGYISLDYLWKGEVVILVSGLILGFLNKILFDDL